MKELVEPKCDRSAIWITAKFDARPASLFLINPCIHNLLLPLFVVPRVRRSLGNLVKDIFRAAIARRYVSPREI